MLRDLKKSLLQDVDDRRPDQHDHSDRLVQWAAAIDQRRQQTLHHCDIDNHADLLNQYSVLNEKITWLWQKLNAQDLSKPAQSRRV